MVCSLQRGAAGAPDANSHRSIALTRSIALRPGSDNPIYVAVTLEDGHRAWSSPIYLIAGADGELS